MVEEVVKFGFSTFFFLGVSECAVLQMVGRKILQAMTGPPGIVVGFRADAAAARA
eukprot:CAMPEP_0172572344 /NCGR_PEP_ID=MMETSP1067-20121228/134764_1 /TAXON_ID=265564 ORGANISM="Thalassiosira punctigera, Strain Tpunct2005C2" /NCGR_SAMPLE_ID=MMETSP1067 /ASSEMBLY_ACC=CAM_ASM_000444 /LENGTH=54 /DNA_ID=CAMNT_0013364865 /DNA_START=36 /DNA_END=200 /DNA_ORIENTATION=-